MCLFIRQTNKLLRRKHNYGAMRGRGQRWGGRGGGEGLRHQGPAIYSRTLDDAIQWVTLCIFNYVCCITCITLHVLH